MTIKNSEYNIKIISSTEAYIVRHPVLRTGKPIESCFFDGDNYETTFHLGIFSKNKLVGVCSFFKNNHASIFEENQYQLRGMAVLKTFQKKGFGKIILNYGETLLKQKHTNIVWCNAREIAVNFYEKCGYKIISEPFNIKGIGKHYVMHKIL